MTNIAKLLSFKYNIIYWNYIRGIKLPFRNFILDEEGLISTNAKTLFWWMKDDQKRVFLFERHQGSFTMI